MEDDPIGQEGRRVVRGGEAMGAFHGLRPLERVSGGGDPCVIRVECAGRRPGEVLRRLLPECAAGARRVLVLQDLDRIDGSLSVFLRQLVGVLADRDSRVTLVDGTGFVGTYLDLIGGAAPFVVAEIRP
jgi:hypothetical protein